MAGPGTRSAPTFIRFIFGLEVEGKLDGLYDTERKWLINHKKIQTLDQKYLHPVA